MKNIKTSDLRLGNWLYYTNETKFLMQVVAIGDDLVQLDFEGNEGDSFEINGNDICPIPLTFDLFHNLDKFWKRYNNLIFSIDTNKGFNIHINYKNDKFLFYIDIDNKIEIKYVHELQNLYHALTGEELEIKREWL